MEWYGWVAWGFALASGGYGAWRSWRTDRSLKLLGETWRLVHFQNNAWMLTNRQPRTVTEVEITLPGHWRLVGIDGDVSKMAPNDFLKITAFKPQTTGEIGSIKWIVRGKKKTARIVFPPKPSI